MKKRITLTALLLSFILMFSACDLFVIFHNVSYYSDFGTAPDTIEVQKNEYLTKEQLPDLQYEGYTFLGWYIGDLKIEPDSYQVVKDITLNAKWKKIETSNPDNKDNNNDPLDPQTDPDNPIDTKTEYTISYYVDYESAYGSTKIVYKKPINSKKFEKGTKLTTEDLPELIPTELDLQNVAKFVFKGWYIGEQKIEAGYEINGSITLKAKWVRIYTISYSGEGTDKLQPIEVEEGTAGNESMFPSLTDENKKFKGWKKNGEIIKNYDFKILSDMEFTSEWVDLVTVTYVSTIGTAPDSVQVEKDSKYTDDMIKSLTAEGYNFITWVDNNYSKPDTNKKITENVTLTAYWCDSNYKLSLTTAMFNKLFNFFDLEHEYTVKIVDDAINFEDLQVGYESSKKIILDFSECDSLEEIPASALGSSDNSKRYDAYTKIIFGSKLKTIGNFALRDCRNLTSIEIPEDSKLESIGMYACDSSKLAEFKNLDKAPVKTIKAGAFYATKFTSLVLPTALETLGDSVFGSCSSLETITYEGTALKKISNETFSGCKKLKNINLGDQIEEFGDNAFNSCEALEKIEMPASLKKIGSYAFTRCKSLKEIVFNDNLEEIGDYAFFTPYDDSSLTKVSFGSGLKKVGVRVFWGYNKPTTLEYTGEKTNWYLTSSKDVFDSMNSSLATEVDSTVQTKTIEYQLFDNSSKYFFRVTTE